MGSVKFTWVEGPAPKAHLEIDQRKVLEAMGRRAIDILRARLPERTGELARSIDAYLVGGHLEVGPRDEKNNIKVKWISKKQGIDLLEFSAGEAAAIEQAAQEEVDRQVAAEEARLESGGA